MGKTSVYYPKFVDCVAGSRPDWRITVQKPDCSCMGIYCIVNQKDRVPPSTTPLDAAAGHTRLRTFLLLRLASLPEQNHADDDDDDANAHFQEPFLFPSNFQRTNLRGARSSCTISFPRLRPLLAYLNATAKERRYVIQLRPYIVSTKYRIIALRFEGFTTHHPLWPRLDDAGTHNRFETESCIIISQC